MLATHIKYVNVHTAVVQNIPPAHPRGRRGHDSKNAEIKILTTNALSGVTS